MKATRIGGGSEATGTGPGMGAGTGTGTTGRPRRSSRETLQDAATELFLEQGYERTTIDEIARRSGVARGTFFNYFSAKGDLLWAEADPVLDRLPAVLAAVPPELGAAEGVRWALLELAGGMPAAPVALVERDIIGASADAAASGLPRLLAVHTALRRFVTSRASRRDGIPAAFAAAATGAAIAAAAGWLDAGSGRGALRDAVDIAVTPVAAAFAPLLPRA
ncbi:helix-turn-helix domain-containing protein [Naasia sp. SYSU D00948]|uniref:TetR/AcrR family transcriptional regulator n=1 Tax=Naasia sp. SYSU D00948 TaxID=2817379 RepID=UPI0027DE8CFA|nr:helix-turn-helix domain-containing protein [Naasia sp. SYSU D00948]